MEPQEHTIGMRNGHLWAPKPANHTKHIKKHQERTQRETTSSKLSQPKETEATFQQERGRESSGNSQRHQLTISLLRLSHRREDVKPKTFSRSLLLRQILDHDHIPLQKNVLCGHAILDLLYRSFFSETPPIPIRTQMRSSGRDDSVRFATRN